MASSTDGNSSDIGSDHSSLFRNDSFSAVAFLKVTMNVQSVVGTGVISGDYAFRWVGAAKGRSRCRLSPIRALARGGGLCPATLSVYVKARRDHNSNSIVPASQDPSDSLHTTLYIHRHSEGIVKPDSDNEDERGLVSQIAIDLADILSKSLSSQEFVGPGGFAVRAALAVKSMGGTAIPGLPSSRRSSSDGSDLQGTDTHPVTPPSPHLVFHTAIAGDAVDTASKLEQLRQEMIDKSDQIDSLKQQAAQIDQVLQGKMLRGMPSEDMPSILSGTPSGSSLQGESVDVAAPGSASHSGISGGAARGNFSLDANLPDYQQVGVLVSRLRVVEEERDTLERQRNEAERKVQAHVQHAAKIKSTYNKLAEWYNNLRLEHAACPPPPSASGDDSPTDETTDHVERINLLTKERDDLRCSLDNEFREKEARIAVEAKEEEAREQALSNVRQQLHQESEKLDQANIEMADLRMELESLRATSHEADELRPLRAQLEQEKKRHGEEIQKLLESAEISKAAAVQEAKDFALVSEANRAKEFKALQDALDAAAAREAKSEETAREQSEMIESLQEDIKSHASQLEAKSSALDVYTSAKDNADQMEQKVNDLEMELSSMRGLMEKKEKQMDDMQGVADSLRVELDAVVEQLHAERQKRKSVSSVDSPDSQISDLTSERDRAILEVFRVRKTLNAELRAIRKERDELAHICSTNDRKVSELTESKSALETALAEKEERLREADQKLFDLGTTHGSDDHLAAESRNHGATEDGHISNRLHELENELNASRAASESKISDLSNILDDTKAELEDLRSTLSKLKDQLARTHEDLETAVTARDELSKKLEHLSSTKEEEAMQSNARLEQLRDELAVSRDTQQRNHDELELLRTALESSRADKSVAEATRDAKIVEVIALSAELSSLKESIEKSSETSSSVEAQLSSVQKALAEKKAEHDAVLSELGLLKSWKATTLTNMEDKESELSQLSARVEDAELRLTAMTERYESAARNLQDETFAKTEAEMELKRALDALRTQDEDRNETVSKISKLEEALQQIQSSHSEAQQQLEVSRSNGVELRSKLDAVQSRSELEISRKDHEIAVMREDMGRLGERMRAEEAKCEEYVGQRGELQKEVDSLQASLENYRAQLLARGTSSSSQNDLAAKNASLIEEIKALRDSAEEKNEEFTNLASLLKDLNAAHAQSSTDYDTLHKQHRDMKREFEALKSEEMRLKALEERLSAEVASERSSNEIMLSEKTSLQSRVAEVESQLAKLSSEKAESEEHLQSLVELQSHSKDLEFQLFTLRSENHELTARMDAMHKIEEGKFDEVVGELIQCKLNLANAWEQIDSLKLKIKQLNPEYQVSPNVSRSNGGPASVAERSYMDRSG